MQQFILLINGPTNVGKSTTVELLMSRHEKIFRTAYDKIKWLISDYSSEKYHTDVTDLVLVLAEAALNKGFSLVADGALLKKTREKYHLLANKNNIKFFEVNLEAPFSILESRFHDRIANAKNTGTKISITTLEGMKKVYARYMENQTHNIPTFDTSILTPEQVVVAIEELITI